MAKKRNQDKKSRTRSGCLTCRDRHMKCDEQQPVCKNCIKSKRKCFRGIRLNFTQYTIYEPPTNPYTNNLTYRILDQSMTIASLYENGRTQYEPYVLLHSWEDLRESDMHYRQDMYCATPIINMNTHEGDGGQWLQPFQPGLEDHNPNELKANNTSILENLDLTHFLTDESMLLPNMEHYQSFVHQKQEHLQQELSPHAAQPQLGFLDYEISYNIGIKDFINVQRQKYYWFLDLFNELNIWKLIIPNYCLRLTEVDLGDNESNTLLINCLLSCSMDTSVELNPILIEQLNHWNGLQAKQITVVEFARFERLLISIVLILLHILIKLQHNKWVFDCRCQVIFNNQIKMYNELTKKFSDLNDAKMKKVKSVVLISSIHSVSILKFFITKLFKNAPSQFDNTNNIPYEDTRLTNEFNTLNDFEIYNMNLFYKKFEYPQVNYNFQIKSTKSTEFKSDSLKLRHFVWYLIKLDFILKNPTNTLIEMDYNFIFKDENNIEIPPILHPSYSPAFVLNADDAFDVQASTTISNASKKKRKLDPIHSIILPNERGVAIILIREYISKLINTNDKASKTSSNECIKSILDSINNSMIDLHVKNLWSFNFSWTLDDT